MAAPQGKQFRCENCGAEMAFDPNAGALACPFCGAKQAAGGAPAPGAIVEHDLFAGLEQTSARGLGLATRSLRCGECGAEVLLEATVTATRCTFCGSPSVVTGSSEQPITPESVVPFLHDRGAAERAYRDWLGKLWFRPSDLKSRAALEEIVGVYVPFWTYDADVSSSWSADAGYYYYTTEEYTTTENGQTVTRTREVQHVRWEPASGARDDHYDDLLVCASRGLPAPLVARLHTFDTTALQPYSPGYLAGFRAERYAVDLREGWDLAQGKIDQEQRRRCSGDVPGDTQRGLDVSSTVSNITFKHVLLPLWIAAYRYGDKVHRFLVNGQTGEVQGTAPWSVAKLALLVLVILVVLVVLAAGAHR